MWHPRLQDLEEFALCVPHYLEVAMLTDARGKGCWSAWIGGEHIRGRGGRISVRGEYQLGGPVRRGASGVHVVRTANGEAGVYPYGRRSFPCDGQRLAR